MLTFNKLTGVFTRRRRSFSAQFLFISWFLLYLFVNIPTSDTLFTTAFRIHHDPYSSSFPSEVFKISGTPSTPTQILQALSQQTAHQILTRAQTSANPNRGPAPAPAPIPAPVFVPAPGPAPAASYSDSEDENMAGMTGHEATIHDDPLSYKNAFRESEFVLRQAMKARVTKQGTRSDEELLAFQTDQVVESAKLNAIQMQKILNGTADQHTRPGAHQSRNTYAKQEDGSSKVERRQGYPA